MTKEETLSFIAYLRAKESIIIESQPYNIKTYFSRFTGDLYPTAERLAGIIKNSKSAIQVYREIAHEKAKLNCTWKQHREWAFSFSEDLKEAGISFDWILESRNVFVRYFPTEFMLFLYEKYDGQSDFQITEFPLSEVNNFGMRYESPYAGYRADKKRINLVYDSELTPIEESKILAVAEFLCVVLEQSRINVYDFQNKYVTVVKSIKNNDI